jgi:hypothetical protein
MNALYVERIARILSSLGEDLAEHRTDTADTLDGLQATVHTKLEVLERHVQARLDELARQQEANHLELLSLLSERRAHV